MGKGGGAPQAPNPKEQAPNPKETASAQARPNGVNQVTPLLRLFKEDWQVGKYGMRV
jgi:hypothetical protein